MARFGELSFDIARATGLCAASGAVIAPGQRYMATLCEREGEEGLVRLDFAHLEWKHGARPKSPLRLFGSWAATMPTPGAKKKSLIDDAELLELFDQLEGVEEPKRVAFRYVLALLLIRKRVIKYEETRKDHMGGRPVMVVKRAGSSRSAGYGEWEVVDPGMDEAATADAIEEVRLIMAGGELAAGPAR